MANEPGLDRVISMMKDETLKKSGEFFKEIMSEVDNFLRLANNFIVMSNGNTEEYSINPQARNRYDINIADLTKTGYYLLNKISEIIRGEKIDYVLGFEDQGNLYSVTVTLEELLHMPELTVNEKGEMSIAASKNFKQKMMDNKAEIYEYNDKLNNIYKIFKDNINSMNQQRDKTLIKLLVEANVGVGSLTDAKIDNIYTTFSGSYNRRKNKIQQIVNTIKAQTGIEIKLGDEIQYSFLKAKNEKYYVKWSQIRNFIQAYSNLGQIFELIGFLDKNAENPEIKKIIADFLKQGNNNLLDSLSITYNPFSSNETLYQMIHNNLPFWQGGDVGDFQYKNITSGASVASLTQIYQQLLIFQQTIKQNSVYSDTLVPKLQKQFGNKITEEAKNYLKEYDYQQALAAFESQINIPISII